MRELVNGGRILARQIYKTDIKAGLNFFSVDTEFIQVGIWNYPQGKVLNAHIHNQVERQINRTYEVLYVIRGSIEADLYTIDGTKLETWTINEGEILILLESGHGYNILEEGTVVLEVKNGPYLGAEIDRRRIHREG